MEILTTFLWCGGAIICFRIAAEAFETMAILRRDASAEAVDLVVEAIKKIKIPEFQMPEIDTEPVVKLLEAVTARLAPDVQKTTDVPMPASLITWIHTWPDQWAIDQQTKLAQEMYVEYGNWDQVGNALIAEAKQTEIPDDDGLLQY